MRKTNVKSLEIGVCKNCNRPFIKYKLKNMKKNRFRPAKKLSSVRKWNSITCSNSCSRIYDFGRTYKSTLETRNDN